MIRESIQSSIDVDVQSWINERASVSLNVVVVPFAFDIQSYLLHVCLPVDLSVLSYSVHSHNLMTSTDLHGTFHIMTPQRAASTAIKSGEIHLVCRGSLAISNSCRTASIVASINLTENLLLRLHCVWELSWSRLRCPWPQDFRVSEGHAPGRICRNSFNSPWQKLLVSFRSINL